LQTIDAVEKQLSITYSECVFVSFGIQQCRILKSTNFMKILPMGADCSMRTDGQTDMRKVIVAFRTF
jgi:hypothetical protein